MLELYGFPRSNYFNVAKMTLLEREIPFEEVSAFPSQEDDYLDKSPMGKVPALETPDGFLSETSAIVDYLEDAYPERSLYPEDPFARAKVRELCREIELYVDLAMRPCIPAAFFGAEVSDEVQGIARANLDRGLQAVARRARFAPWVAGDAFGYADIYLYFCLPLAAGVAAKFEWGDPIGKLPGASDVLARVAERASAKAMA